MIIGKDSFKKGGLLFVGVAAIAVCIFATFASGSTFLQFVAVVAFIATVIGAIKIYKTLKS